MGVWRSAPSSETEPLSFNVQEKERGREQFASLRTGVAMSVQWAAILVASGWGSNLVLEAKNLCTDWGRGGGGFIKTSPNATAIEEAEAGGFARWPFFPLVEGAKAWAYVGAAFGAMVEGGRQAESKWPEIHAELGGYFPLVNSSASQVWGYLAGNPLGLPYGVWGEVVMSYLGKSGSAEGEDQTVLGGRGGGRGSA